MTGPVLELQESLRQKLGLVSLTPIVLGFSIGSMVLLPCLLVMWAAGLSREWGNGKERLDTIATRFTYALIPLGFGMWIAHYGYHFVTSYDVAWPVTQRFVIEHGLVNLGAPEWVCGCCIPAGAWLIRLELLVLDVGLLLSLYLAYRIAEIEAPKGRAFLAFLPWGVLILALFAFGVWMLLQPMEMRGTMMTG